MINFKTWLIKLLIGVKSGKWVYQLANVVVCLLLVIPIMMTVMNLLLMTQYLANLKLLEILSVNGLTIEFFAIILMVLSLSVISVNISYSKRSEIVTLGFMVFAF